MALLCRTALALMGDESERESESENVMVLYLFFAGATGFTAEAADANHCGDSDEIYRFSDESVSFNLL